MKPRPLQRKNPTITSSPELISITYNKEDQRYAVGLSTGRTFEATRLEFVHHTDGPKLFYSGQLYPDRRTQADKEKLNYDRYGWKPKPVKLGKLGAKGKAKPVAPVKAPSKPANSVQTSKPSARGKPPKPVRAQASRVKRGSSKPTKAKGARRG